MRSRNPAHRYTALHAAVHAAVQPDALVPEHPLELALWNLLRQQAATDDAVEYAHEIFTGTTEREIMQAWLLANATDVDIFQWLRVPEAVTRAYRFLFFDCHVFRDELNVLRWVREYETHQNGTPYGAKLLQTALHGGVDQLAWLFGRGTAVVDPNRVVNTVMTDAFFRSRAHRGASIASEEVRAAHGFMNTAFKAATAAGNRSAPDAGKLLINLRFREMTEPVAEIAQQVEILH